MGPPWSLHAKAICLRYSPGNECYCGDCCALALPTELLLERARGGTARVGRVEEGVAREVLDADEAAGRGVDRNCLDLDPVELLGQEAVKGRGRTWSTKHGSQSAGANGSGPSWPEIGVMAHLAIASPLSEGPAQCSQKRTTRLEGAAAAILRSGAGLRFEREV